MLNEAQGCLYLCEVQLLQSNHITIISLFMHEIMHILSTLYITTPPIVLTLLPQIFLLLMTTVHHSYNHEKVSIIVTAVKLQHSRTELYTLFASLHTANTRASNSVLCSRKMSYFRK
jgi:hypothetical protein